jgi:hypothetical protein
VIYLLPWHGAAAAILSAVADFGWLLGSAAIARATRPSAPRRDAVHDDAAPVRGAGVLVAVLPLLVPPAIVLLGDLRGFEVDKYLAVTGTAMLLVLAYVRMSRLLLAERRARAEARASHRPMGPGHCRALSGR